MNFISTELENYCLRFSTLEDTVLSELNRETHLKRLSPRMLSGHLQGSFLTMISSIIQPTNVLEIGTFTGYSAICLAKGLSVTGKLITIDSNAEIENIALKFFKKSGLEHKIDLLIGNAENIIPSLTQTFDMVFIDADKKNYSLYFDLVFDKVRKGGIILVDNVLWSGKILLEENKMDLETKLIHNFNEKIFRDDRVENIVLPLRDGIMMLKKK